MHHSRQTHQRAAGVVHVKVAAASLQRDAAERHLRVQEPRDDVASGSTLPVSGCSTRRAYDVKSGLRSNTGNRQRSDVLLTDEVSANSRNGLPHTCSGPFACWTSLYSFMLAGKQSSRVGCCRKLKVSGCASNAAMQRCCISSSGLRLLCISLPE